MGKRKRSPVQDAAVTLLTDGLDSIDSCLLETLEKRLRIARLRRPVQDDRSPSSSTNSTSASSVSDSASTPLTTVDEASPEPCGPLGRFLFTLLLALPKIEEFFSAGPAAIAAQVLARGDARLEILKKYGPRVGELPIPARFERFLTDRSLALSYERSKQTSF
ncbi:hypothetical protein K469DRAFT_752762 [Zopfia rhizophila CBS 207.26]|uniref:Uncharacterized protein n=1 Tax=Zopfia rhizophila CBS 207.26 TaxID=1314779 RepID=A0A6A6DT28_9PEZI|nr:hypothetical protein K469DRAFT_752762 [Zopfia rhizophila CBS 207.26]